jgi:hypothetical protein
MHFVQADTIVPNIVNSASYDRYAYVVNNPINGIDATGHWVESLLDIASIAYDFYDIASNGLNWENGLSLIADAASLALPVFTGGGLLVKAAFHADDAIDAIKLIDKTKDSIEAID